MRVYRLTFRTPGIFLDEEGNNFRGRIYLELKNGDDWVSPESLGIQVLPEDFPLNKVVGSYQTASLALPKRGDGTRIFNILLPDSVEEEPRKYRIVVEDCLDCYTLIEEGGYEGSILDSRHIVVDTGTIPKQDE